MSSAATHSLPLPSKATWHLGIVMWVRGRVQNGTGVSMHHGTQDPPFMASFIHNHLLTLPHWVSGPPSVHPKALLAVAAETCSPLAVAQHRELQVGMARSLCQGWSPASDRIELISQDRKAEAVLSECTQRRKEGRRGHISAQNTGWLSFTPNS